MKPNQLIEPNTRYIRFYDNSEELFSWMITAGMLIEQNSIDGFMMQTTNAALNLTDSNSFYYQGTIPKSKIIVTNLDKDEQTASLQRELYEPKDGKIICMARVNMYENTICTVKSKHEDNSPYGMSNLVRMDDKNISDLNTIHV